MAHGAMSVAAIFHVTFATSALSFVFCGFLIWNLRSNRRLARKGRVRAVNTLVYPIYEYILWAALVLNGGTILLLAVPGPYPHPPEWFIAGNYKEAPHTWLSSLLYFVYWLLFEVMADGFGLLFLHPGPSRAAFTTTLQYGVLYGVLSAGLTTFAFNYSKLRFSVSVQMWCDTLFLTLPCLLYLLLLLPPPFVPRRVSVHPYAIFSLVWRLLSVVALHAEVLGTLVGAVIVIFRSVGIPVTIYTTLAIDTRVWQRMGADMLGHCDIIAVAVEHKRRPRRKHLSSAVTTDSGTSTDTRRQGDAPAPAGGDTDAHDAAADIEVAGMASPVSVDGGGGGGGGGGGVRRRRAIRRDARRLVSVSPQGLVRWTTRAAPRFPGHASKAAPSGDRANGLPVRAALAVPLSSSAALLGQLSSGRADVELAPTQPGAPVVGYVSPDRPTRRRPGRRSSAVDCSDPLFAPVVSKDGPQLRRPLLASEAPTPAGYGSLGSNGLSLRPSSLSESDVMGAAATDGGEYVYEVEVVGGALPAGASTAAAASAAPPTGYHVRGASGAGSGAGYGGGGAPGDSGGEAYGDSDSDDGATIEIACVRELKRENRAYLVNFAYLEKGRELDEGASSVVYDGLYYDWSTSEAEQRSAARKCVIRKVAIKQFTPKRGLSDEVVAKYHVENQISAAFSHPNIVMYHGLCVDPPHISLVFELCDRGNLFKLLASHREPLSWVTKLRMAVDGAAALAYLHSFDPVYLHRDIKSPNFLVTSDWTMKLSDFGESRLNTDAAADTMTGMVGTPQWMAPEMMARRPYTQAVDIYSYGVVLWELLTEQQPFAGMNYGAIFHEVLIEDQRPHIPPELEAMHPEYVAIIQRCWVKDPDARPSAEDVLQELDSLLATQSAAP